MGLNDILSIGGYDEHVKANVDYLKELQALAQSSSIGNNFVTLQGRDVVKWPNNVPLIFIKVIANCLLLLLHSSFFFLLLSSSIHSSPFSSPKIGSF
jgi:hypothetical protein